MDCIICKRVLCIYSTSLRLVPGLRLQARPTQTFIGCEGPAPARHRSARGSSSKRASLPSHREYLARFLTRGVWGPVSQVLHPAESKRTFPTAKANTCAYNATACAFQLALSGIHYPCFLFWRGLGRQRPLACDPWSLVSFGRACKPSCCCYDGFRRAKDGLHVATVQFPVGSKPEEHFLLTDVIST